MLEVKHLCPICVCAPNSVVGVHLKCSVRLAGYCCFKNVLSFTFKPALLVEQEKKSQEENGWLVL